MSDFEFKPRSSQSHGGFCIEDKLFNNVRGANAIAFSTLWRRGKILAIARAGFNKAKRHSTSVLFRLAHAMRGFCPAKQDQVCEAYVVTHSLNSALSVAVVF